MEIINITKTYLPPLEEYTNYLEGIWDRCYLTNNGPLLKKLEAELKRYLGVKYLFMVTNGTVALQIAIKSLGIRKEIITSPFSFVATVSSIVWEGCKPVFVDIDPCNLNIDTDKIEAAIDRNTEAILVPHIYGNPCDIEKIQKIAKRHRLKIIFDAAHTFGVRYKKRALAAYGDISILSFHATKIFHTIEGGAVLTNDERIARKISYMRNFGFKSRESFFGLGINGKNSEFHAAMGLCILPRVKNIIKERKRIAKVYNELLFKKDLGLKKPKIREGTLYNYSYYPIILPSEKILLDIQRELNKNNIFPRRYFYPSLNKLNYVVDCRMENADRISKKVLCLPIYVGLQEKKIKEIISIIIKELL